MFRRITFVLRKMFLNTGINPQLSVTSAKLRKARIMLDISGCPCAWNHSYPTGQSFIKFDIKVFFSKSAETFGISLNSDKNNGSNLHACLCTFTIISQTTIVITKIFRTKFEDKLKIPILSNLLFVKLMHDYLL
jgi:hypothetical protein